MPELEEELPPLTQSDWKTSGCPESYVAIRIEGQTGGESVPSERGRDVHNVMAKYITHCTANRVTMDWEEFNRLSSSSGPMVAGPILDGLRDRYEVDWEHSFAAELVMALDEDFNPTLASPKGHHRYTAALTAIPGASYTDKPVAYITTLDHLLLREEFTRAKIEDFKSTQKVFDADDEIEGVQAILYAFVAFKHIPTLEVIKFEFVFVRYAGCVRPIVFKRSDMPAMQTAIARARQRQRIIHANPDEAPALPCKQCAYCPKAKNLTCSIADWNEWTTLSMPGRLMALEFYRRMSDMHRPLMREWAAVNGPIQYRDGNGRLYEYGPRDVAHTRYPLDATSITILGTWLETTGENLLDGQLSISSTKLKQRLKTIKRQALREQFEESAIQTETKPEYRVFTPDEGIVDEYNRFTAEEA
jgi:hypothetical protein